ncbi:MAG TPA: class I SAM-dependent methyltransferase [Chloroflexota bacterium]|nr:class I SAM-dependent methyltransferase [Chloroflexota bacterium]
MTAGWVFDEFAHAGEEHLDPRYVASYDRKALVDPTEDLALFRDLGLDETCTVIDLGAGTGAFALAVAPLCRRVVAVDVSPAMLALLRAKAEQQGLGNLEYMQAGFLGYEHRGAAADFVYSRHALHHLPDFWKALALQRLSTFLKPGGILQLRDLVFSFSLADTELGIEAWLRGAAERSEDGWTRPELETHLREEYSPFSWVLEAMLDRAGFEIRQANHHESGIYSAYTCVKR